MKFFDNGSFYIVQASRSDVSNFASTWPCFGSVRPIAFQFHKQSGDLVDIIGNTSGMDDSGVAALSEDCQQYAANKL